MRTKHCPPLTNLVIAAAVVTLACAPIFASQVRPVNLEEMTRRAATIFSGKCVGVVHEFDATIGCPVTVATFQVNEALKGQLEATVSVRFLGALHPQAASRASVPGLPSFHKDEDVVLFLYGESTLGLTSPVGWSQGKFTVMRDKQGRKVAVNGFANRNLLRGVSAEGKAQLGASLEQWEDRADVDASALLDMVSALRGGAK